MKRWYVIISAVVLLVAAGIVVWRIAAGESDEDVIRRRLHEVTELLGKKGNEGFLVQMEHAKDVSRYFDEICDVRLPKFHKDAKMSRENIIQNVLLIRKFTNSLDLGVYDLEFYFQDGEPLHCKVLFTGMINANLKTGERFREGYDLEIVWLKKNNEWLIEKVGFSGILEK